MQNKMYVWRGTQQKWSTEKKNDAGVLAPFLLSIPTGILSLRMSEMRSSIYLLYVSVRVLLAEENEGTVAQ